MMNRKIKEFSMKIWGLSQSPDKFESIKENANRLNNILSFKKNYPLFPPIFVLLGGTGTGKSTLFNSICNYPVSKASIERPSTGGGILYINEKILNSIQINDFPWDGNKKINLINEILNPIKGSPKTLNIVKHNIHDFQSVIIDSPDIDSVLEENLKNTILLCELADYILFVITPEKYADLEPFSCLKNFFHDGKDISLILNKKTPDLEALEVKEQIVRWGFEKFNNFFVIDYEKKESNDLLTNNYEQLKCFILNTIIKNVKKIRSQIIHSLEKKIYSFQIALKDMLDLEIQSYNSHYQILEKAHLNAQKTFEDEISFYNEKYYQNFIKPHIKKAYEKYDIMAPVRKIVSNILILPGQIFSTKKPEKPKNENIPQIEIAPLLLALSNYQLYVSKNISKNIFSDRINEKKPDLMKQDIEFLVSRGVIDVNNWLKAQIYKLNKEIPIQKKIGIHSISLFWGAAIIGLESFTFGGISLIEIILDSILAPYVTKSAADLFASNELKNIIKNLQKMYSTLIYSIIEIQHKKYLKILEDITPLIENNNKKTGLIILP